MRLDAIRCLKSSLKLYIPLCNVVYIPYMRGNGKIYTVVYSQVSSATSRHDWRTLSWSHSRIRKPFVSDLLLGGLFKIGTHVIKNVSDNIRYFEFYIYIYILILYINIYYTYVNVCNIYIYTHLYTGQWFLGQEPATEAFVRRSWTNPDPAEDARDRHLPAPPPPLSTLRQTWDLLILNSYGPMAILLLLLLDIIGYYWDIPNPMAI